MSQAKNLRKIQSFVKRTGRLSKGQSIGLTELWRDYGIDIDKKMLNLEDIFSNQNDITIEIGFGNGDSLLEMAIKQPDMNFLGIEVYEAGVGRLVNEASKKNVSNLRVIKEDAVEVIENNIPDKSISHCQLFFPDPWHKKRHHKRRIVLMSFLDLLSNKLKENAIIANKIVQAFKVSLFSATIEECNKAVAANHGIKEAFSTGSQNHQPPQPNSL